ncbi:MAG: Crp/Fnr family transcriptional regulator [Erysipelotrichaceae bacterium]|nr:Crp/Fnr family transcriptional regulator [Erysipelotrichaceae bacterium]
MITDLLNRKQKEKLILRHFKEKDVLFHEDEECHYLSIIIKGKIIISSYLPDGKELIYNNLSDGEMFGNNLLFSDDTRYKGDIIAESDGEIYLIEKDNLLSILTENKEFLKEYLRFQSEFAKSLNSRIKLLSFDNAKERFLFYMYSKDGKIEYDSVSSLAKTLFMERETLSRLLGRLEKEKIIYRDTHTITMYN